MSTLKNLLIVALLIVCIALGYEAITVLEEARLAIKTANQEVSGLRADIKEEVKESRKSLFQKVDRLQSDLDRLGNKTVDTVASIVDDHADHLDHEVTRIVDSGVTLVNASNRVVLHAGVVMGHARETSELLLDCEGNPNCFANRVIGTMQAIEGFSNAGRDAMVEVKHAAPEILDDVKMVSDEAVITARKGAEASEQSVEVMKNIRKQTEPLPLALRIAGKFALPAIGYITGVFLK